MKKEDKKKKKEPIPKEFIEKLDIKEVEKKKIYEVTPIVEKHQIRFTLPSEIRRQIDPEKNQKFKVELNKKNKQIIFSY